jgi:hypothetical protein
MTMIRIFWLCLCPGLALAADLFPGRPYLDPLGKPEHRQIQFDDFKEPYLTCVTARQKDLPVEKTTGSVRTYLKSKALPIRGHFSKSGQNIVGKNTIPLPTVATTGRQREEIEKCTREYCGVKLNTDQEKGVMEKAPDKLAAYHQLLIERIEAYLKTGTLLGYEGIKNNVPTLEAMLQKSGFFPSVYPECANFFSRLKFNLGKSGCKPVDSFLVEDLVELSGSDKLKPVLRFSEVFEIPQPDKGALFFQVIIYTNHFFDASLRIIETKALSDVKSAVILTDIVDIDELKKSSVIRFLYKGKMASAVSEYQVEELDKIH